MLGITLQRMGKHQEAIKTYNLAISIDANNKHAFNNIGSEFIIF